MEVNYEAKLRRNAPQSVHFSSVKNGDPDVVGIVDQANGVFKRPHSLGACIQSLKLVGSFRINALHAESLGDRF